MEDRLVIDDILLNNTSTNSDVIMGDSYVYRSVLTVTEASYTDTGYYACHHRENEEGDDELKIYIYVEGNLIWLNSIWPEKNACNLLFIEDLVMALLKLKDKILNLLVSKLRV